MPLTSHVIIHQYLTVLIFIKILYLTCSIYPDILTKSFLPFNCFLLTDIVLFNHDFPAVFVYVGAHVCAFVCLYVFMCVCGGGGC